MQASPALAPQPAIKTTTLFSDQSKQQASAQTPEARQPEQIVTRHMHTAALDHPFEADYAQARSAMHSQPAINLGIILNDHGKLQDNAQASEAPQLFKPETLRKQAPFQNLSFKAEHGQANPEQLSLSTHYKPINAAEHVKQQGGVPTPVAGQASKT